MHRMTLGIYRLALRLQSIYMLGLAGLSFLTMPVFLLDAVFMRSLIFTLCALATAIVLRSPRWRPAFLFTPLGILNGISAMIVSFFVFLLAMGLGYLAVINMGLEEPTSRHIAITTALPTLVLTGIMWWSALLLAFAPRQSITQSETLAA